MGLVTCFATHGSIPTVAPASCFRYTLGDTPTSSVNRVLNVPKLEHPTAKHTSVTLMSPRRNNAIARSILRVIRYEYGDSPYALRNSRLRCPADMFTPRANASTSNGCAYSRSIRSLTRRNRAKSPNRCSTTDLLTYAWCHVSVTGSSGPICSRPFGATIEGLSDVGSMR